MANPKVQEAALGEEQEGQQVVEEGEVAAELALPGGKVGVGPGGRHEPVRVLGSGAWPLQLKLAEGLLLEL